MEVNDPTHLTRHVCADSSRDPEKYKDFTLSGRTERERWGDRHLSGSRQRVCEDIYHLIYYVMNAEAHPNPVTIGHQPCLHHVKEFLFIMNH